MAGRRECREGNVAACRVGEPSPGAYGQTDVGISSIDGCASCHRYDCIPGIAICILDAIGYGLICYRGKRGVVCSDVGVDENAAPCLERKSSAIAEAIVRGDGLVDCYVIVCLQRNGC